MKKSLIDKYNKYREILILCKMVQIHNYLDQEVENKIPTFESNEKVKVKVR